MATKKKKKTAAEGEGPLHYAVTFPIAGTVTVQVEAQNEDEAIEKGWEKIGDDDADVTWEAHTQIVTGNVFHGTSNNIEVDLNE
jgi:hypothetical protein